MAIFNSYVSLPEGIDSPGPRQGESLGPPGPPTYETWVRNWGLETQKNMTNSSQLY